MSGGTPAGLLRHARTLVDTPSRATAGLWPRAAALLARQALEEAVDAVWARRAPGLERLSARAQLACLPEYLPDRELAGEVSFTWAALSDACHQHGYDVGPTAQELRHRFDVVERLVGRLTVAAEHGGSPALAPDRI